MWYPVLQRKEHGEERFEIGLRDRGLFVEGGAGYTIFEGTEQDIVQRLLRYSPYIKFKVYPILSVEQAMEIVKKLSQA